MPVKKITRVETLAKKLLVAGCTNQDNHKYFVGILISTMPAVWKAPLHLRKMQILFQFSLYG